MKYPQAPTPYLARLHQEEPFLRRLAAALLRDEHAAEDLVQETLLSAVTTFSGAADGSASPRSLRSWLGTALRRKSIDELRRRGRSRVEHHDELEAAGEGLATDDSMGPDEIAARLEQQRLLHDALARLNADEQSAVVLRFQGGLTVAEIGARTGVPVPTIKSRLERGLRKIRAELERGGQAADPQERDWRAALGVLLVPPGSAARLGAVGSTSAPFWASSAMKAALFASVAIALVAAGIWTTVRGEVKDPVSTVSVPGGRSPLDGLLELQAAGSLDDAGRLAIVTGTRAPDEAREATVAPLPPTAILGSVVSRTSRAPVLAQVRWGSAAATAASPSSGYFSLRGLDEDEANPVLTLTHPKFEPLSLSLADLPPERDADGALHLSWLRMEPLGRVTVSVVDGSGRPLEAAKGFLHRSVAVQGGGIAPAPGELDEALSVGTTDSRGMMELSLSMSAALWVKAPDGRCALATVGPLQSNTIRVDGPRRSALFTGSVGRTPVVNRAFPLAWDQGEDSAAIYVWTDGEGRVDLPVGAGRLSISKSEPRLLFDGCRIRSDEGWRTQGNVRDGTFQAILRLERADTELALEVARNERKIRMTDAVTGEPVEGRAWCHEQHLRDGQWSGVAANQRYPIDNGELVVGKWFTEVERGRRFVAVPGYEVLFVEGPRDLAGAELFLKPAENRSLRLLDGSGQPTAAHGTLQLGSGISIAFGAGRDGMAGPFPWMPGDAWWLRHSSHLDGTSPRISAEELSSQEVVEVRGTKAACELRVVDVPPDAPALLARSTKATVAGVRQGTSVVFCDLSPGLHAVGPEVWVDQMRIRVQIQIGWDGPPLDPTQGTDRALQVPLAAGETREIPWNPAWRSDSIITGRVTCTSPLERNLFAYPLYGAVGTHINMGTPDHWLPCDPDGVFRTHPSDPVPVAFLFGVMELGTRRTTPVVLDSQRLREDGRYQVALTSVEISASNAAEWKAAAVSDSRHPWIYSIGEADALDAPMDISHGPESIRWNPSEPLSIDGLPAHTSMLRIAVRGTRDRVEVSVQPGAFARIEVEVPIPEL
ncbi:RNA polymerase sigma factor SigV [Planctomycetes bacterium Poly30]|uniref:RNA polymerase sigma factor SigV n=1 Tax=Saltatorellus ferox TaxID=2528018 RepID=A0A518EXS2_9BACT|nr:RNA polymerase sigma factor SigV [Planctomycetes bacterium Poly30]